MGCPLLQAKEKCCLTDVLYSPVYYWIKFITSWAMTVSAGLLWGRYTAACDDPSVLLLVWCCLLMALWAIAGFIHLGIIVGRFLKKSPPSEVLYDGPIVGMVYWPMTACYGLVAVISLVGIVVFHTQQRQQQQSHSHSHSSTTTHCATGFDGLWVGRAYKYLFVSIIMLRNVRRNRYQLLRTNSLEIV